jgi:hypothetical protein
MYDLGMEGRGDRSNARAGAEAVVEGADDDIGRAGQRTAVVRRAAAGSLGAAGAGRNFNGGAEMNHTLLQNIFGFHDWRYVGRVVREIKPGLRRAEHKRVCAVCDKVDYFDLPWAGCAEDFSFTKSDASYRELQKTFVFDEYDYSLVIGELSAAPTPSPMGAASSQAPQGR